MNTLHVLDCTLRDGGYCNQWQFGFQNIKKITNGLVDSGIDVIECGFLTNKEPYDRDITKFNSIDQISEFIPQNRNGKLFVVMMNYGEYNMDDLPVYDGSSIDGIRVAFHKKNRTEALELCSAIKKKGYKVFVQAMVSLSYQDEEFLKLICAVNEISPYAFYIVDSFGNMKAKDLTRLFYMVEHNLKEDIWIGFHCHNNLQLAYSNAQTLVGVKTNRNLVVDSSVYGMGRGAGNLNTELFIQYLNENYEKSYELSPLLSIIDEILNRFYQRNPWGYSLPNYISATHNAHPNYAGQLDDKKTLTVEGMNEIFSRMDEEKKVSYDKAYMEELYIRYMETGRVQEDHKEELKNRLEGKKVILIAPGKSAVDQKEKIIELCKEKELISISVNFDYKYTAVDYIFLSNRRRFKELDASKKGKCIVTSNIPDIPADEVFLQTKYKDLVNCFEAVNDNAGLMAMKFLIDYGVSEIMLAGFDGYSHDESENYGDDQMAYITKNSILDAMNIGMSQVIKEYSKHTKISFVTAPKHVCSDISF